MHLQQLFMAQGRTIHWLNLDWASHTPACLSPAFVFVMSHTHLCGGGHLLQP